MKKIILALFIGMQFTSCATKNVNSNVHYNYERQPASLYEVPPEFVGKNFFEEHNKIYTKANLVQAQKISTFTNWVRNNPIELYELLRNSQTPNFETGAIPFVGLHLSTGEMDVTSSLSTLVVTMDKDVREVLDNPTVFSVRLYQDKMDNSVGKFMLGYDKQEMNKEKPWMRKMMMPEDLAKIAKMTAELTRKSLAESAVNGRVELVNAIARRVPIEITRRYFGFEDADLRSLYRWSRATQYSFFHNAKNIGKYDVDATKAAEEMKVYLTDLINRKRSNKSYETDETVLARLLRAKVPQNELLNFDDGRIKTNIMGTLVGGIETTQAAVVQSLNIILKNNAILAMAKKAIEENDDKTLGQIIWEALRFDPVNPFVIRYATTNATIAAGTKREYHVKQGQVLLVGTQSAMFDDNPERVQNDPRAKDLKTFRIDRGGVNDKDSLYLHLGYGHHKCLGDYVAEVEVVQIVKEILKLNNLHKFEGRLGEIGHSDNINFYETPENPSVSDKIGFIKDLHERVKSPFPESFVVEFDQEAQSTGQFNIPDPRFTFEEYLVNYDRDFFRKCLSDDKYHSVFVNVLTSLSYRLKRFLEGSREEDLFLCRLPEKFHNCVGSKPDLKKFSAKYESCKSNLSELEQIFFEYEILGKTLNNSKLPPTSSIVRTQGFPFEDDLKFYDRSNYRRTFLDPLVAKSFPVGKPHSTMKSMFYARVDFEFRKCAGKKVELEKKSRSVAFNECMNDSKLKLDDRTVKYYKEIILADEKE